MPWSCYRSLFVNVSRWYTTNTKWLIRTICYSHFYLIQAATTKTGRQTKLSLPLINPYHKAVTKNSQ
ncbi:hypothetical protein AB4K20DRAFT_1923611 [Rhizopus microsporus]